jgi:hypothetical protein
MSATNLGNQYITFDYKHPATGEDFNTLLRGGIKPGVYEGGLITPSGGVEISIAPFVIYINTGDDKLCRIETRSAVSLSVTEATPVIALTYTWSNVSENWLNFNQRASGSAPLTNEIILGECTFAGGIITGIDYTDKTWGLKYDGTVNPDFNSDQVDNCDVETSLTPTSNVKIPTSKAVVDYYFSQLTVGSSIKTESEYIAISEDHPWLCLSLPSVDLTTSNYSTEFINKLRARKYIYDEFGTSPVSAFSGSWSSNVFTLTDNAANKAMLAELAEDWLYHGSPVTDWRILSDGTTDFNITGINVTSRTITVNLDGETTSGTSIIIYTNRVYRQATQARHFSEAGLATYQAGGGKSGRLFRRDQMQRLQGNVHLNTNGSSTTVPKSGVFTNSYDQSTNTWAGTISAIQSVINFDSYFSPNARTSSGTNGETIAKSSSRYEYIYVGSYTA